jgi:RNA polymerase sigma-70 factor (ECF subfamily)
MDHLFRHASGRMTSALTRAFGLGNLDLVEDAVQDALLQAHQLWSWQGIPANPDGWLYRAARNKALDILRRQSAFRRFSPEVAYLIESDAASRREGPHPPAHEAAPAGAAESYVDGLFLEGEIADDQLRMIFACCHPNLPLESQVALTLKTLCGFGLGEIASAFLASESTVEKRITRAKEKLREGVGFEVPAGPELAPRLEGVLAALYLLFNEGYYSAVSPLPVRKDVCLEAMRLAKLLSEHARTRGPEPTALLALMCFHASRLDSRHDDAGHLLLLKAQDRSLWDKDLIAVGYGLLDDTRKAPGAGRYQLEACIACSHCLAPSYAETDWSGIRSLYDALARVAPSPIVSLNRAIAVGQAEGPLAGLAAMEAEDLGIALASYPLYHATAGELRHLAGENEAARGHWEKALRLTKNPAEARLLREKLDGLSSKL